MRRREFPVITRLTQIGRLLIALRIAQGSPSGTGVAEEAHKALLRGVKDGRAKPTARPPFPEGTDRSVREHPQFPAAKKARQW